MNIINIVGKKFTVSFLAAITIVSMILSASPVAFFVANAQTDDVPNYWYEDEDEDEDEEEGEYEEDEDDIKGSISGIKFEDTDNDGSKKEAGESTLSGWTIRLYEVGEPWVLIDSDVTDEDGEYEFDDVPEGSYKVCEVMQEGWTQTFATSGSANSSPNSSEEGSLCQTVNIDTDEEKNTKNFGNYFNEEDDQDHKVDICHWNGQTFELLNVAKSSIGNAHGSQGVNDGDIIPAFDEYDGQNLEEDYNGASGAEVLENDCEIPPLPECEFGGQYPECNPPPECEFGGEYPECNPEPEQCVNLLENGSFEEEIVTNDTLWQKFASVTGWIVQKVSDDSATTLELHRDWMSNEAADGEQYAELDGDQPVRIIQSVATIPGAIYELKWAFAPRQDTAEAENELGVEIDGVQVETTGPSAGIGELDVEDWTLDSYEFEAGGEITEISFLDLGPESIESGPDVGTFLDDAQLCLVREPEPEMCELTIVSSPASVVVENNAFAVATYNSHPSWTASVPGATWIWESFFVADPVGETTRTFEETFIVTNTDTASLTVAADNSYKVFVNDVEVGGDSSEYNFFSGNEDFYDLAPYIVDGENTFRMEVKNWAQGGGTAESNPAGALYKIVITAEDDCEVTTDVDEEEEEDETFRIEGYKYEVVEDSYPVPVAGWNIYLYNNDDASTLATTTDVNGYYWFEVEEGTWEVTEEISEGWEQYDVEQDGYSVELDSDVLYCLFELYEEEEWNEFYKPQGFGYSQDEDSDSNCDFYNLRLEDEDEEEEVIEDDEPEEEERGGGGGGSGTKVKKKGTPTVAGASTSFCPLLNDYMQIGIENDPFEVMKLQMFLNIFVASTSITGVFDETTDAHVKLFQEKYRDEILEPWFKLGIVPHNQPTGFVYKLTRWKINDIVCPGSEPYPTLEGENLTNNVDLD